MASVAINRFEWLKAVMQAESLTPTAKVVASALAVKFFNADTGQLNPKQETVADFVKVHRDTVKRVLRELRNAGWLLITGTGGRSQTPDYHLRSPGKIVPFGGEKRGDKLSPEPKKRGDNLCEKGGQIIPPHYKEEQTLEQKAREPDKPTASRCPSFSPRIVPEEDTETVLEWNRWLCERNYPPIQSLGVRGSEAGVVGYRMPRRYVPSDEDLDGVVLVKRFVRWRCEMLEEQGGRYATG